MTTTVPPNGASPATIEASNVNIAPGANVVVVRSAAAEEPQTPEQIRAQIDMLSALLAAPVVQQFVTGITTAMTAKASAEAEKAKAEIEKTRITVEEQTKQLEANNQRAFSFAKHFLYCLSVTGGGALFLVGWFAHTGALKDASLSAFAMFVVGSIFGGTIYGTTLRKQEKP